MEHFSPALLLGLMKAVYPEGAAQEMTEQDKINMELTLEEERMELNRQRELDEKLMREAEAKQKALEKKFAEQKAKEASHRKKVEPVVTTVAKVEDETFEDWRKSKPRVERTPSPARRAIDEQTYQRIGAQVRTAREQRKQERYTQELSDKIAARVQATVKPPKVTKPLQEQAGSEEEEKKRWKEEQKEMAIRAAKEKQLTSEQVLEMVDELILELEKETVQRRLRIQWDAAEGDDMAQAQARRLVLSRSSLPIIGRWGFSQSLQGLNKSSALINEKALVDSRIRERKQVLEWLGSPAQQRAEPDRPDYRRWKETPAWKRHGQQAMGPALVLAVLKTLNELGEQSPGQAHLAAWADSFGQDGWDMMPMLPPQQQVPKNKSGPPQPPTKEIYGLPVGDGTRVRVGGPVVCAA